MNKQIQDDTIVEVINNHGSSISYSTDKVTRTWQVVGETKKIRFIELQEACNARGGKVLFSEGALLIKDSEVRERLDLPALDKYVLDTKEMEALLKNRDLSEIEEFLQYSSNMLLKTFVDVAISLPIADMNISNLIKKYSGTDVALAIEERHADKESVVSTDTAKTVDSSGRAKRIARE